MQRLERFTEIWLCDFEFISNPGERPVPICMVAHELHVPAGGYDFGGTTWGGTLLLALAVAPFSSLILLRRKSAASLP